MAVRKLFWEDPYLTQTLATVTSVDGPVVTLERTVAYAFAGGQASDAGTIGGCEILEARTSGQEILYTLPDGHGLASGDEVLVRIDWDRRYCIMRLHFAAELVLELVNQFYGRPPKIGANVTAEKARVDFAWDGSIAEVLPRLQREFERLVAEDLLIVSAFADEGEQRRYWEIEGFARVACGGTHLRSTGEVGAVTLRRDNIGRGKERIEIRLAG